MIEILMTKILPASALILSVVNGIFLFFNYMRDKPNLRVSPVHPEIYQWWIRLEDVDVDGSIVRRYAFLAYFSVANKGLRDVAVNEWRLNISNQLGLIQCYHKKVELKPYNLPEAQFAISDDRVKAIRIFGQKTQNFHSDTNMIKSGDSTSGMACWIYSVYGADAWNPKTDKSNRMFATLKVRDVFDNITQCKMTFNEMKIDELKEKAPDIGNYLNDSKNCL